MFEFSAFVQPIWYFNLNPKGNIPYFPDYDLLDEAAQKVIAWDTHYSTREVSKLDAAYQAWNRGVIVSHPELKLSFEDVMPTVSDNYHFVRKYFHPLWSVYVLFIRLLSFKNPFIEISAFWRHRKVERIDLCANVINHQKELQEFNSGLLANNPKISVIIPTLNRYPWLVDALKDLETQDYKNFEVIVVDQSEPFQADFYSEFNLDIKLIRQEEKALWLARNTAIKLSDADYIAMYEDDVRVPPYWLSSHLKCLDFFKADISAGVFFPSGLKIPQSRSIFRWSEQFATGNACLKKEVFEQIGLFDRQFEGMRMGDGEFGLRAYLAGYKSISNPVAWCEDVKAGQGGLRQMGSWDGFRTKSWLTPRPVPSVLYLTRKYFGITATFYSLIKGVPPSLMPYRFKRNSRILLVGSLLVFPFLPLIIWQVGLSWARSSKMLKYGSRIERL